MAFSQERNASLGLHARTRIPPKVAKRGSRQLDTKGMALLCAPHLCYAHGRSNPRLDVGKPGFYPLFRARPLPAHVCSGFSVSLIYVSKLSVPIRQTFVSRQDLGTDSLRERQKSPDRRSWRRSEVWTLPPASLSPLHRRGQEVRPASQIYFLRTSRTRDRPAPFQNPSSSENRGRGSRATP